MTSQPFMTDRDVILEIRADVKDLTVKIDRIDREGSIGTQAELTDHEARLRVVEGVMHQIGGSTHYRRWLWPVVTSVAVNAIGWVLFIFSGHPAP